MMTKRRYKVLPVVVTALLLAGCSDGPFNEYEALVKLQAQPLELDGEQVMLNQDQINCGERDDLWVVLSEADGRSRARLTDKGRALGFSDDIHIGDPGMAFPYGQIRGKFPVHVSNVHIKDVNAQTKIIDARTNVVMDHSCLSKAPQLMGLHHGDFSQQDNPTYEFKLNGEVWELAGLVH